MIYCTLDEAHLYEAHINRVELGGTTGGGVRVCLCAVEENCGSGSVGIWFNKTLLATDQIPCLNQENWLHAKLIAHVYPEN